MRSRNISDIPGLEDISTVNFDGFDLRELPDCNIPPFQLDLADVRTLHSILSKRVVNCPIEQMVGFGRVEFVTFTGVKTNIGFCLSPGHFSDEGDVLYGARCSDVYTNIGPFKQLRLFLLGAYSRSAEANPGRKAAIKAIQRLGGRLAKAFDPSKGRDAISLFLGSSNFDDNMAKELAAIDDLDVLDLSSTRISDAGIRELSSLRRLSSLDLSRTVVTSGGLVSLRECGQLQVLRLAYTQLADDNFEWAGDLNHLSSLDLSHTRVTEFVLRPLIRCEKLTALNLKMTRISDAGCEIIGQLRHLCVLNLSNTSISDAGVPWLYELQDLQKIDLTDTQVSSEGLRALSKALPRCTLVHSQRKGEKEPQKRR